MPDKSCTFLLVKFNDGIGSFTFIIHRKRKEDLFFASVQKKRQNESLLSIFSSSTPKKKKGKFQRKNQGAYTYTCDTRGIGRDVETAQETRMRPCQDISFNSSAIYASGVFRSRCWRGARGKSIRTRHSLAK